MIALHRCEFNIRRGIARCLRHAVTALNALTRHYARRRNYVQAQKYALRQRN